MVRINLREDDPAINTPNRSKVLSQIEDIYEGVTESSWFTKTASVVNTISGYGMKALNFSGKSLWVVTTASIVLLVPLVVEIDRERGIIEAQNLSTMLSTGAPTTSLPQGISPIPHA
eukprot:TRINITY_DN2061_c0_g1::TRINITY_DN2061_c0_g1_i1::g.21897::m.21897 TRINITY_DN2061_c0_g1::TRINITY_DN2061_c0_g1_i1::g.21897  ORF type:complete len:137 (-),score=26.18,Tom22/PF04281.8/3.6e-07 TRINITY_DN2061_c0_g1_i1:199-549(-)